MHADLSYVYECLKLSYREAAYHVSRLRAVGADQDENWSRSYCLSQQIKLCLIGMAAAIGKIDDCEQFIDATYNA